MNSKTQVIKDNSQYKTLIDAVVSRIGMDSIEDVNNHGINGGFSGFIYYTETTAFYRRYRKVINAMVLDMAEQLGEQPVTMVCNFNCIKDESEANNVGRCIYGGRLNDDTQMIENALAWFAAEEVCRMFEN